ncbi:hypothetical protein [Marinobacterium sp. BA1]|uniref:hypothetical protein n=1 Tax=Marinobacterium sp. BA1 TaxID=3138931 RepID=UPI0032E5339D
MSAVMHSSDQKLDQANKDQLAPVGFFDFSMHHIMKNPRWRMHMRMMLRREDRMEDRLEDLTDAKSAMAFQRAMLLKLSTAHEWQRWQADQATFRNMLTNGAVLKLDAERVERLGVSFLEKRAFEAVHTNRIPSRDSSDFHSAINEWISDLSSEVMLLLSAGDRHDQWSLGSVDDAPDGMFVAGSDYWRNRAALALDTATNPGVVLQRWVDVEDSNLLGYTVAINLADIFTQSITVNEVRSTEGGFIAKPGAFTIEGLDGVSIGSRALFDIEHGNVILPRESPSSLPEPVLAVVKEMRECALQGPAPELLIAEQIEHLSQHDIFWSPEDYGESNEAIQDEISDLNTVARCLKQMAFNNELSDAGKQALGQALGSVYRDVYVDPGYDNVSAECDLIKLGNLLNAAQRLFVEVQTNQPSAKEDLLRYMAESKPEQAQTM